MLTGLSNPQMWKPHSGSYSHWKQVNLLEFRDGCRKMKTKKFHVILFNVNISPSAAPLFPPPEIADTYIR